LAGPPDFRRRSGLSAQEIAMYRRTSNLHRVTLVLGIVFVVVPFARAADNAYVPAAGGLWSQSGNWSLGHAPVTNEHVKILVSGTANKAVTYDSGTGNTLGSVTVDGSASYYGAIWHLQGVLTTYDMYLGNSGPAWHWMEGPAYLWVNDILYVGYVNTGPGHFYLATISDESAGLYVGDLCYVGYGAPGDFDHTGGIADLYRLYVGQNDPGTYTLRSGRLEVQNQIVIGNGAAGTVEQTGGAFVQTGTNGIIMGLNTGGAGTYLMKAGTLEVDHLSLAWNGDAFFTQSGGTVTTVGDVNLGCQGTHPMQAWYKLNQDDGTAVLNIGGDLFVGVQTYAKYEQTGGTCNVGGNLGIWQGGTTGTSRVYLGTSAGQLNVAGEVINHTGYYDQDGGILNTTRFTNDSTQGVNLDNSADCRATNLIHNAGTLWMWRNATLRGKLALPPNTFWMCNFTNNATFQMGSAASAGGTFTGHLTNNGTFNYYQGDFTGSTLTNYGTVNLNADFTCNRLVNQITLAVPADRWLHALGTGYPSAVENNGDLTMLARSHIDVGTTSKLVNNGRMYAGAYAADYARVHGAFENNGLLQPCNAGAAAGSLLVEGNFTSGSAATLRVRIRGAALRDYDHLTINGNATLAGTLQVQLTDGFVPAIGDSFSIVSYYDVRGQFSAAVLPFLPGDRLWQLQVGPYLTTLSVVAAPALCRGDGNCDGAINWRDIDYLIAAQNDNVSAWSALFGGLPTCRFLNNDSSGDGHVNWRDIDPFIARMNTTCR
jgi:hypothetical protein